MPPLDQAEIAIDTPIGRIGVVEENASIVRLNWNGTDRGEKTELLERAKAQIEAYFAGDLKDFDLPLKPAGSEFQQNVYRAMSAIPYGDTSTYGAIAKDLDVAAQPVGQACGSNPIPIIIPCHRVLAANGVGGFSGKDGVEMKIELLKHEGGFPYLL